MRSVLFTLAALAVCASHTLADTTTFAPAPLGVVGHTAVVANNTVFVQGGQNKDGTPSAVSYAIILDAQHSLKNATWQDTTTFTGFTPRDFAVTVPGVDSVVTCGTMDGAIADAMTCDQFSTFAYNLTKHGAALTSGGNNRFGAAVALSTTTNKAYIVGGSDDQGNALNTVYIMDTPSAAVAPSWRTVSPMSLGYKYHTATWVDGTVNGIVVIGGLNQVGQATPLNLALTFSNGNWSQTGRSISVPSTLNRFGHTAVNDGKGNIYLYGGFTASGSPAMNDHYVLNTADAQWTWKSLAPGPEARGFHSATLLPDGNILYMFGQNGIDKNSASSTYFTYDTGAQAWGPITNFPTISTIVRSPNIPPPPPPPVTSPPNSAPSSSGNNQNTPNSSGTGSSSSSATGLNVPMIAGISAAGVILIFLIILLILLIRRRNRRRPVRHYQTDTLSKKEMKMAGPTMDDDEKAKNAKAFMIRRPPSVYLEDDRASENDVPHYKSQYYGDNPPSISGRDSPSVAEYDLMNRRRPQAVGSRLNTLSTVSSVAERRRYVEEQQRQLMDGYENAYNHPPPFESLSDHHYNSKEERESEYDDYHEETLEELSGTRRSSTGPRYPKTNNTNRRGQNSQYEHPAADYFQ